VAVCSRRDALCAWVAVGGSAAGPKPGRDGFSVELARSILREFAPLALKTRTIALHSLLFIAPTY
jgi:hypothetical protein